MLSVLINTHMLMAARDAGVERFFFSSSACVYAADKQTRSRRRPPLKEADAYPAMPEDGYGWEKLFSERMCRHFREDFGLQTRVARYHNVYGPHGTYDGGREKAPAAICRKVDRGQALRPARDRDLGRRRADAQLHVHRRLPRGHAARSWTATSREPLNLGSDELVTINQLVDIVEEIAGVKLERRYNLDAPQGVRGRNSDNTLILELLGWEPTITLEDGLEQTYAWIESQMTSGRQDQAALAFEGV